jgi:hypothetical protein
MGVSSCLFGRELPFTLQEGMNLLGHVYRMYHLFLNFRNKHFIFFRACLGAIRLHAIGFTSLGSHNMICGTPLEQKWT